MRQPPTAREKMASRARARSVGSFDIAMVARRYWAEQEWGMTATVREDGASSPVARP